jgi:solute carrier family 20 (sodium-dependent phosphate transporter)
MGPLLFRRPVVEADHAMVPNYAVIQHDEDEKPHGPADAENNNDDVDSEQLKNANGNGTQVSTKDASSVNAKERYRLLLREAREKHHALLRTRRGPLGWAMRTLHANPYGAGSIYELHNLRAFAIRLPAYVVVALTYGLYYDIHRAQLGVLGTPEGHRMQQVYSHAKKYSNEVEYLYSFVQVITACTASFAHGANDVGNAVGVWASMYQAWYTEEASDDDNEVPLWQIAVIALTICFGFITYGYNIMRGMCPTASKANPH